MDINEWNKKYPAGTEIYYYPIIGKKDSRIESKTRSQAWTIEGGEPVIMLDGMAGFRSLHHVEPVNPEKDEAK